MQYVCIENPKATGRAFRFTGISDCLATLVQSRGAFTLRTVVSPRSRSTFQARPRTGMDNNMYPDIEHGEREIWNAATGMAESEVEQVKVKQDTL